MKKFIRIFLLSTVIFLISLTKAFADTNCSFYDNILTSLNIPNKIILNRTGETVYKLRLNVKYPQKYSCKDKSHSHNSPVLDNEKWEIYSVSSELDKNAVYIDDDNNLHCINNILKASGDFILECSFTIDGIPFTEAKSFYIEKIEKVNVINPPKEESYEQWERILDEIENTDKSILNEDITGNTFIPTSVLNALRKTQKTLIASIAYDKSKFSYTIDGKNITNIPANIAYVSFEIDEYKDSYISSLANNNDISIFDILNDSGFYGTISLVKDFPTHYADKELYLYRLSNDKLKFISSSRSNNKGDVSFSLQDGGTYVITLYKLKLDDNISSSNSLETSEKSPSQPNNELSSSTPEKIEASSSLQNEDNIGQGSSESISNTTNSQDIIAQKNNLNAFLLTLIILLILIIIYLSVSLYQNNKSKPKDKQK